MRHTVRYGGIEPPPVSHERQAAFVSVYRIEAARETVKGSGAKHETRREGRSGDCVHRFAFSALPMVP